MNAAASPRLKIISPQDVTEKICVVVGTRPGIVKQAPVIRALTQLEAPFFVIHTGQHYSYEMDAQFFEDLELPAPGYRLKGLGRESTHGRQTAEMLRGVERVLIRERPGVVIVGGDANTNLAAALAARKLQLKVAHLEAGLRSDDWRMPEEHNRVMIDHISDVLFAPTTTARDNLRRDNVRGQIIVTGNTIVDAVLQNRDLAERRSQILEELHLRPRHYVVVTVHREETVDNEQNLNQLVAALLEVAARNPELVLVFPMHPRTTLRLDQFGLRHRLDGEARIMLSRPLGYLDFLLLLARARATITDSGGIQEEACILGVPCVTVRESTERPEAVAVGANIVAGLSPQGVASSLAELMNKEPLWENPFGDGTAGLRIAQYLRDSQSVA